MAGDCCAALEPCDAPLLAAAESLDGSGGEEGEASEMVPEVGVVRPARS